MSTNEIAQKSKQLFGFEVTNGTVYNSLLYHQIPLRDKSEGVSKAKCKNVPIAKVVKNIDERWRARWLIATKKVQCRKSILHLKEAEKLRKMLNNGEGNVPPERIEEEFKKAREQGFPYYFLTEEDKVAIFRHLQEAIFLKNEKGQYYWNGKESPLATIFHPHFFECKNRGKKSPVEFFNNDEDLKRGIKKVLCLHGKVTISSLRTICRDENASSLLTNFPPRVAMVIIRELFPERKDIEVLDPCAGFSGRMIGCAATGQVTGYTGIDLSSFTYQGLKRTQEFLKRIGNPMSSVVFNDSCINTMKEMTAQYDLILTSPPFCDLEEYKGVEPVRDYKKWIDEFTIPFVDLCYSRLKEDGKLAIYSENINNNQKFKDDLKKIIQKKGLQECPSILFEKHKGLYKGRGVTPIYIWRRAKGSSLHDFQCH